MLFESLGIKPVLHDRADAPLLIVHTADVRKRPRRDVGPSGLAVLPVARSPCGGLYATAVWPVADHEDQAASSDQRKNQPIHQFERRSAVAGKHHAGHSVFVEQELVNRVEPVENGEQRDEVEQPAVGSLHSGVPGQQEKTAADGKPGQPRADLEREDSKNEQDDSDGEVFARKAPDHIAPGVMRTSQQSENRDLGCTGPSPAPNLPQIGRELGGWPVL